MSEPKIENAYFSTKNLKFATFICLLHQRCGREEENSSLPKKIGSVSPSALVQLLEVFSRA